MKVPYMDGNRKRRSHWRTSTVTRTHAAPRVERRAGGQRRRKLGLSRGSGTRSRVSGRPRDPMYQRFLLSFFVQYFLAGIVYWSTDSGGGLCFVPLPRWGLRACMGAGSA